MWQERQANVMAVNCAELKILICFLSNLCNQTHGQNRGFRYSQIMVSRTKRKQTKAGRLLGKLRIMNLM